MNISCDWRLGFCEDGDIKILNFLEENMVSPVELSDFVTKSLSHPIESADGNIVESGLYFLMRLGKPDEIPEILCKLILSENHFRHEDIIRIMQDLGDELFIPYIKDAIKLKQKLNYLDHDDYGAFYKQGLWALTSIGTEQAKDAIASFVESDIPELRNAAIYRLEKFEIMNFGDDMNEFDK
jgi:hypothetical protein